MVNFKSLVATAILAIITSSSALPTAGDVVDTNTNTNTNTTDLLAERQVTQARVYYCEHINWGGACRTHEAPFDSCQNLGSDWNDRISSIKNDIGWGVTCRWYEHNYCGATGGGVYDNQNDANLADGNGFWNDRITSWYCTKFL